MTWSTAKARLTATMLTVFGEPVIVRVGVTDTELAGLFDGTYKDAPLDDVHIRKLDGAISFQEAEFAATGGAEEDLVIIGSTRYSIVSVESVRDGLTTCLLRRLQ